jgi:hypothetical protein
MSQRDMKRSMTHAPAIVTRAVPTLDVKGPVLRIGALQAFFCHLWATEKMSVGWTNARIDKSTFERTQSLFDCAVR